MGKRPILGHQFGEFAVLFLLTLLSVVSFWDTAAPEVSSRMSITLTIILTLAAYTSQRPAAIEKVPHLTVQDWVELGAMVFVIFVAVLNVVAVVYCGGEHPEAPEHMQAMWRDRQDEMCAWTSAGMRYVDFMGFMILSIIFVIALIAAGFVVSSARQSNLKRMLK